MFHFNVSAIVSVAAGFEDVVEADEVTLDVGIRVGDAVADAGLRSEVHHNLRMVFGEDAVDEGAVGDVAADEGERRETLYIPLKRGTYNCTLNIPPSKGGLEGLFNFL